MVPKHIGIIMDGNRRFARKLSKEPWKGHEWGSKKLEQVLEWCREVDIRQLTLYTFSVQNFDRPKEEFDFLMRIFSEGFDKLMSDERLSKYSIKIRIIGRLDMFPKDIQKKMQQLMEMTKDNTEYMINFAMAYGGREEIIDAVKEIARKISFGEIALSNINESLVRKNLYLDSDPDLIIRTGGEHRTSNFLAFQGAYSEYVFVDKMWPEFEKADFLNCLDEFNERQRRFGA